MKRITPVLLLSITSCVVAPAVDSDTDEPVGEAPAAIEQAPDAAVPSTDAATEALADLPRWHAYLRGKDSPRADNPPSADWFGQVVAVREGDEEKPEKWITLSLQDHWKKGDRYLDELREAGLVSATDLLMITSELLQHGDVLQPLPAHMSRHHAYGVEGGGWSPDPMPDLPGSDHTGGPVVVGKPTANPSTTRPGWAPGVTPPPTHPHHQRPRTPAEKAREEALHAALEAYHNGVDRGDPEPLPFPYSGIYNPGRGEHVETFKCEGTVFRGYKRACLDFQAVPAGVKWGKKLSAWSGRYFNPHNVAMTQEDWTTVCKFLVNLEALLGCTGVGLACLGGEVVTVGGVTLPCAAWTIMICGGQGFVANMLPERCSALMGMK